MVPCSCPSSVLCLLPSLLLLLQLPSGGSQVWFHVLGPSKPIVAELGKDATLPCSLDPAMSAENMELRWFRSNVWESVFTYQDGQERHEELMAQYAGRTSLVGASLREGKAAVTIHKVQAADNGLYTCFFSNGDFSDQAILELQVAGVGSAPQVHITGPDGDGVRVVCKASGWFPEPQVQWRHPHGEQFLEFFQVPAQDSDGLFSVETALVVRDSSAGNVTCSFLNLVLRQEKAKAIVIPEPFFPRVSPWKLGFLVILPLLLLLLLGAACYTWREHSTHTQDIQEALDQRKAAYLAAWRKAQLYADWRKEQFRAWSITLDPVIYSARIVFSDDRKSVTSSYSGSLWGWSLLGFEGITSGRCYWEVEVRSEDRGTWALGIWRKDEKKWFTTASPRNGFWTVGKETAGLFAYSDPPTPLPLRQVPHRVGVFLDYDHGDLSFYDMTEGSHIFSFPPESFSGILLPYFDCYSGIVSMTLCPLEAGPPKPAVPMNNLSSLGKPVSPQGEGIPSGSGVVGAPLRPEHPIIFCPPETESP